MVRRRARGRRAGAYSCAQDHRRARGDADLRRSAPRIVAPRQRSALAWRQAWRPSPDDAGRRSRTVGDDARVDETRARADPGHADVGPSRYRRSDRARPSEISGRPWRRRGEIRGACGGRSAHRGPDGPPKADDPMLLYFTSGTTARSKLVVHTHASYPIGHLSTMYGLGIRPGDAHLNISSPGWAKHAWSSVFAPWNAGATIIALALRFEPRAALDALVEHEVTVFCAPPTVWRMLIQHNLRQWKVVLREVNAAGGPVNPEIIEQVRRAWVLPLRDSYGQTETTMMIGNSPGQRVVPGSMGRPLPGYRVALLDADGLESDSGEIAIPLRPRTLGLMSGYQNEHGQLMPIEGEYYKTGDVASRDADGFITFIGRADDVFKSSDYRLSPFELESVLIEHPSIAEAAVVPAPDPMRYTIAKGYVALAEGCAPDRETAAAIFKHMRGRLSSYKLVRRLEFFELPKTVSGKIRRVELRMRESALAERGERAEAEFRIEDFPET